MNAAVFLMAASVVLMALIAGFLLLVNRTIERGHRERLFGDVSHVQIPDDARDLTNPRKKPRPPYRPF